MLCLGIETSCDETGLALVRDGRLLGQVLRTQEELHAVFGGVVPEIASREHYRCLAPLLDRLLAQTGACVSDIDVVAVARGPGLLGSLLTGMAFAKGLALGAGAKLIGVNHLQAHLLAAGLEQELQFPALGVLVSGGHTNLYLMHSAARMERLGRTLDDAAGEAFDKVAKMLNFPYPGGRHIDRLAQLAEPDVELFPRPYLDNQNLDFSFSGLKTAVAVHLDAHPELRLPMMGEPGAGALDATPENSPLAVVCASLNFAIADTLRVKAQRALSRLPQVRALILAGGVAANTMIRESMAKVAREARTKERNGLAFITPSPGLCTDNGAMIAFAGELLAREGYAHGLDVDGIPRGRAVPLDYAEMPG